MDLAHVQEFVRRGAAAQAAVDLIIGQTKKEEEVIQIDQATLSRVQIDEKTGGIKAEISIPMNTKTLNSMIEGRKGTFMVTLEKKQRTLEDAAAEAKKEEKKKARRKKV